MDPPSFQHFPLVMLTEEWCCLSSILHQNLPNYTSLHGKCFRGVERAKKDQGTGLSVFCQRKNSVRRKKNKRGGEANKQTNKPPDFKNLLLTFHVWVCTVRFLNFWGLSETMISRNGEFSLIWATCNFKIKFGNSKENLFNPSKRKNCKGEVLVLICQSGDTWQVFNWRIQFLRLQD